MEDQTEAVNGAEMHKQALEMWSLCEGVIILFMTWELMSNEESPTMDHSYSMTSTSETKLGDFPHMRF